MFLGEPPLFWLMAFLSAIYMVGMFIHREVRRYREGKEAGKRMLEKKAAGARSRPPYH
jgi:hypothetical protein